MRRALVLVAAWLFLVVPTAAAETQPDLLVVRVAPALESGSADLVELVVLRDGVDLGGLTLGDGEGEWRVAVPQAWPAGSVLRFVSSTDARIEPGPYPPTVTFTPETLERNGSFALAKGGDELVVRLGDARDVFVYGKGGATVGWAGDPMESSRIDGRVYVRSQGADGAWIDSDTAADWSRPRIHHQWHRDQPATWFDVQGEVRAFVCPDRCHEEVLARIAAAEQSLRVNLYDLSLREAVEAMAAAAGRGVQVDVLLDPRPVGASARKMDRIAWSVDTLRAAGAEVFVHDRARFAYDHGKYLVVDGRWSVVLSENANPSGWAPDGKSGNRGWGLAVEDAALAQYMAAVFDADAADPDDARLVTGLDLHPDAQAPVWGPVAPPVAGRLPTLVVAGARVQPLLAPEHLGDPATSALVSTLAGANESIAFQQLNLPLDWERSGYGAGSPLITALFDASERGVRVCGMVSGAFEDGDLASGNDRTVHLLADSAPRLDVRLGTRADGIYHNKGWLVDGRFSVVGSANGNLASQALNREVSFLVDSAPVAAYYGKVLDADLQAAAPVAAEGACKTTEAPVPGLPLVPHLVLLLVLVRGRRRAVLMASGRPARRRA